MNKREIEFRAFDEGNKVMHNDFQFIKSGNDGNDWIVFTSDKQRLSDKPHPFENPYFQQQLKITQFTGLLDKHGKKIFEGDILSNGMAAPCVSVVKWDNDKALFNAISKHRTSWLFSANALFEIIGNVFDNPELLGDL